MKRLISALLSLIAILSTTTSCGGGSPFKVSGTIEGLGTQNIHIIYRDGGRLRDQIVAVMDSKFEFEGNSPQQTVVEIFNNMRIPLGYFVAKNGEEITIKLSSNPDPLSISVAGDPTSEQLVKFLSEHKNSLNAAIAGMVRNNPKEMLSAVLLNYFYDPSEKPDEALKLFEAIDYSVSPENLNIGVKEMLKRDNQRNQVKPIRLLCSADSMTTFSPLKNGYTLYCFDATRHLDDSIARSFSDIPEANTRIAYIRMSADTVGWYGSSRLLPKRAVSLWAPGSIAEPGIYNLNITSLPYYIVTVDGGKQAYRGTDLAKAKAAIKKSGPATPKAKPEVNSDTIRAGR